MSFPKNGLCERCINLKKCPVNELLEKWAKVKSRKSFSKEEIEAGRKYDSIVTMPDDIFDKHFIEKPIVAGEDDDVMKCDKFKVDKRKKKK